MAINWVLVASKSKAKIYEFSSKDHHLKLILKLENPKANMKNKDLESDRPGVTRGPFFRTALRAKKGTQDHEMEIFSKQILDKINAGRNSNSFDKIIMVVDPGFQAHIDNHLKEPLKRIIFQVIPKNYMNTPDKEVENLLKNVLRSSFLPMAA